jgi:putative flippase GtrA
VSSNEPTTLARRFVAFCLSVLAGIALLYLAVQLLAQFWGWLALIAGIVAVTWITVRIVQSRRNRW